jgi:hypothetical protein
MGLKLSGMGRPWSGLPYWNQRVGVPATRKMVKGRGVVALPDTSQQKHHIAPKSEKNE